MPAPWSLQKKIVSSATPASSSSASRSATQIERRDDVVSAGPMGANLRRIGVIRREFQLGGIVKLLGRELGNRLRILRLGSPRVLLSKVFCKSV
jgi:hypothetical protein